MPAKRTARQIAASKRNLEKARAAKKRGKGHVLQNMTVMEIARSRKTLKTANGTTSGIMVPTQIPRQGYYTARNSSGETIRKRYKGDAEAIRRGFYEW